VAGSALSHAAPDGHALKITTYATLSIAAAAGTRLDYDPLKSLRAVAVIGPMSVVLVVRNSFPAQSIEASPHRGVGQRRAANSIGLAGGQILGEEPLELPVGDVCSQGRHLRPPPALPLGPSGPAAACARH
jgi:hypothetical protein